MRHRNAPKYRLNGSASQDREMDNQATFLKERQW